MLFRIIMIAIFPKFFLAEFPIFCPGSDRRETALPEEEPTFSNLEWVVSRWVMDGPTLHAISRALVYEAEPMGSIKETLKSIDERTSSKCRSPC